jgi:hypothetical protein
MFRKNVAAAIATAALASAALAAPASATPIDPVLIDTPGHTFQFGDQCAPGAAPGTTGDLDWRENTNPTPPTIAPHLEGFMCLQGTQARTRMRVVYHDDQHQPVSAFSSNPATGNGSPLNAFYVNAGGPRVSSGVVTHVVIELQRWDAANQEWDLVATNVQYY